MSERVEPRRFGGLAALVALGVTLASCSAPGGPGSGTPTPQAPTPASASAQQPTPSPTPSQQRSWPALAGQAGGWVSVDGEDWGRDGPESTEALLAALGEPDEQTESATCQDRPLPNTTYRWGDFAVVVLGAVDTEDPYGDTYPPGSVAGWLIDPALDGRPGLEPDATGPEGTTIGTPLAGLESLFGTEEWDDATVQTLPSGRAFVIFRGDTTGATFALDDQDEVSAMAAGYECVAAG